MDIYNIVAGILAAGFVALYAYILVDTISIHYKKKALLKALEEEVKKGEHNHDEQHNNSN